MSKLSEIMDGKGNHYGYMFMCPGCDDYHQITDTGPKAWGFNGSVDRPTFTPSYLTWNDPKPDADPQHDPTGKYRNGFRCHSFITNGSIQFLGDCTHKLAGKTVELPDMESVGDAS